MDLSTSWCQLWMVGFTLSVCISARLRKGGNMNPWFCITLDQQVSEQKWWHLSCNWNNNNTKKFPLIWWSVSLLCQVNHGEILAGWPVQGFRADLVCRLPTQLLIIEVNSQQRCWIARDGKWRDSWDDSFPFPTKKLTQVGMSAKPKASPFLFGKRLFLKRQYLHQSFVVTQKTKHNFPNFKRKSSNHPFLLSKNTCKNSQICWGFYLGTRRELLASCRLRRAALESGGKVCQAWQTPLIFLLIWKSFFCCLE